MNLTAEFGEYVKACKKYRRELEDVVNDLAFLETPGNQIRYAVDFSEIHAYILHQSLSQEFCLFADDAGGPASAIEHISLQRLFEELKEPLIMLQPYTIEFDAFLLRLREKIFLDEMKHVVNVFAEAQQALRHPEYREIVGIVEKAMGRGEHLGTADYGKIISFLQKYAPSVIVLLGAAQPSPLNKAKLLFQNSRFSNFAELAPDTEKTADGPTFSKWYRLLKRERKDQAEFPSFLDAEAVDLVEKANQLLKDKNIRLLLVTRSPSMLRIDEAEPAQNLWSKDGDRLLRHPRMFYLLYALDGRSATDLGRELAKRLETVNFFLETVQDGKLNHLASDEERVGYVEGLLQSVRASWMSSEALDAFLGKSLATESHPQLDENTLLRALEAIASNKTLSSRILQRLRDLSVTLGRQHDFLGFYVQDIDTENYKILRSSIEAWNYPSRKHVFRTKLQAIPYTFQFYSEPAAELLEILGSLGSYSWEDALQEFVHSFEMHPEFDYERLLAIAYIFGTLGKWKLAEDYCERAIELAQNSPQHEAYFFLAICMRKRVPSYERLVRSLQLLDKAIASKRNMLGRPDYEDPRYLKEKGTQILRIKLWFDEARSSDYQAQDGLELLASAWTYCQDDILLKIQIINNELYYYVASNRYGEDGIRDKAKRDFGELLGLQREAQSDEAKWPPYVLDTLGWAEYKLFSPNSGEAILRIRDRLQRAIGSPDLELDPDSRKEYSEHLKEFDRYVNAIGPAV